ncbi:P-loop containing nucleoside triphosphate hydrolase protein [Paraphaeosphaeria sporulosa]|uniref:p-loop containing nucleoside triphosphate hydrolase protein n=1 Tax=Paraphaeosphaeria sporulosa TaxID=1460663 RepID=A0A177CEX0_9PLEO|nr:P-loop containing nucleoside triphosphate hydrolase protein [Paraphaeosphaeria sporulosa]OAG05307.1 P-loop containing nucleoside triphosphate hydrolase protein [Paraphaeosphaeria sporulosa]
MVACPLCNKQVSQALINEHIDSGCADHVVDQIDTLSAQKTHSFFTSGARKPGSSARNGNPTSSPIAPPAIPQRPKTPPPGTKRLFDEAAENHPNGEPPSPAAAKRKKLKAVEDAQPLAERMRPMKLDDVFGQELIGPNGILRGMLESNKIPSMVLWGKSGTGKTTIARIIANASGSKFVEINSTSTKLEEVRRIFFEALKDLQLTGRRTIVFCDEIHRFSKTQQDAFLGPVESGTITLIAATTENPSFKVISALLSRCRTFTLDELSDDDLLKILQRAMATEDCTSPLLDTEMLRYFASFSDGDARTALNLLELAMSLSSTPNITKEDLKKRLTKTLVYDRAGDQHYENISAMHKSIRGSDPNAAVYYLTRMLKSGEDPRYIARRLVVVASEDVGLADNALLSLATATYSACEKIGMPECAINLSHCVVALALAPKSTRAYRALRAAEAALQEPGVAALPIPLHLRNAPTRLMKEMGYSEGYKYNPDYLDGKVKQEYLPEGLRGRTFLEDVDLGTKIDEDLIDDEMLRPELED